MPTAEEINQISKLPLPKSVPQDPTWVLTTAFLGLLVLFSFALLNSGSVRYKSAQSSIITVLLGGVLAILAFWTFGFAFAFGDDEGNGFIAYSKFASAAFDASEFRNDYAQFTFQIIGVLLVVSIFGQGTLERARFFSFSLCAFFLAAFLYPVLAHWTFGKGWLNTFGFVDFAGSCVIHAFGGMTALLVTFFLQHRRDKEDPRVIETFPHHSPLFIGLGGLVLTFTLTVFVSGFADQGAEGSKYLQAILSVNALIAAAAGGLLSFIGNYFRTQETSLIALARGAVAGIVSVSAGLNDINPWAAVIIGAIGGIIYLVVTLTLKGTKIDDPAHAVSLHLAPGVWGTLAIALFSRTKGLFYGEGFQLLGFQCVGILAILAWALLILAFVIPLKGTGIFKVLYATEQIGIDQHNCGGEATVFIEEVNDPALLSNNISNKRQIFA